MFPEISFIAMRGCPPSGSPRLGVFSGMVAITRGGLAPAAIGARELDMRVIDTFCVASYPGEKVQDEIKVLKCVLQETARGGGEGKVKSIALICMA